MSTRIQLRRDTSANWTSNNPILAQGEPAVETDTGYTKTGDGTTAWNSLSYQKVNLGGLPSSVANLASAIVTVAAPTGVAATDLASWQAAMTKAGTLPGALVIAQPGLYMIAPVSGGAIQVPNKTTVWIPDSTTIQVPANTCTAAHAYNLFVVLSDPGVGVDYIVDGVIDGNIANGNYGGSEFIFGINLSNALGCSIRGRGEIKNWRGEAIMMGWSDTINSRVVINGGLRITNCGVKQASGDVGNPRQGISVQTGKDVWIDDVHFDTIGAYAIDFEQDIAADVFDGCGVGPNCTFRYVGANGPGGNVNFSNSGVGTILPNNKVYPSRAIGTVIGSTHSNTTVDGLSQTFTVGAVYQIFGSGIPSNATITITGGGTSGTLSQAATTTLTGTRLTVLPTTNLYVVPANANGTAPANTLGRIATLSRYSGDVILNSNTWALVPGGMSLSVPAQSGDLLRVTAAFMLASVADFTSFDFATTSATITPINYLAPASSTPRSGGQPALRYQSGDATRGRHCTAFYPVINADIINGLVTITLWYRQNTGTNQTLYASAAVTATSFDMSLENIGPGW